MTKVWNTGDLIDAAHMNDLAQISDVGVAGTPTGDALNSALVPKWKPSTAYTAGAFVLNPSGQIVSANTTHTSGATYSASNWTVISGGGGTSLPTQTGNAGKFLTTDGTAASWGTPAGGGTAVTDATTTAKGIVQLAGDLAGTAAAPTVPGLAAKAPILTPTATKTAAYTVALGELAMMNVAGGATTLTLPTAPADKAQVGYRAIGATTAVPLVVNRGGSTDTIGAAGATSATLPMPDEVVVLQYDAPNTRWLAVSAVKTQASLDARYLTALPAQTQQTGTAYTLALGDAGTVVETTNSATTTITVPLNSAVAFPIGTSIVVRQYGTGQVTLAGTSGVLLRSRGAALTFVGQYSEASLTKRATDEWVVSGDVTA